MSRWPGENHKSWFLYRLFERYEQKDGFIEPLIFRLESTENCNNKLELFIYKTVYQFQKLKY